MVSAIGSHVHRIDLKSFVLNACADPEIFARGGAFFMSAERIQIALKEGYHLPASQIALKEGHHRPASEMPFKWPFAGGPMLAQH